MMHSNKRFRGSASQSARFLEYVRLCLNVNVSSIVLIRKFRNSLLCASWQVKLWSELVVLRKRISWQPTTTKRDRHEYHSLRISFTIRFRIYLCECNYAIFISLVPLPSVVNRFKTIYYLISLYWSGCRPTACLERRWNSIPVVSSHKPFTTLSKWCDESPVS